MFGHNPVIILWIYLAYATAESHIDHVRQHAACVQCNSQTQPKCNNGPFDQLTGKCKPNATGCMKQVQEIHDYYLPQSGEGKSDFVDGFKYNRRVIRECAYMPVQISKKPCIRIYGGMPSQSGNFKYIVHQCFCNEEVCNSHPTHYTSATVAFFSCVTLLYFR